MKRVVFDKAAKILKEIGLIDVYIMQAQNQKFSFPSYTNTIVADFTILLIESLQSARKELEKEFEKL